MTDQPEAEQSKRVVRLEFVTRLMAVAVLAILIVQTVGLILIRNTQLEGTPTGRKLVSSADRILDCTDPGMGGAPPGKCYTDSQKRTAEVLGTVQRIIILSAACSASVPPGPVEQRITDISDCVATRLAKGG